MVKLRSGAQLLLVMLAAVAMTACQAPGSTGASSETRIETAPIDPSGTDTGITDANDAGSDTGTAAPACNCPASLPLECPTPLPTPVCPQPSGDNKHFFGKLVVGESEFVYIEPGPLKLRARVDSGATTSSLHAGDIVRFERDGEAWVRFTTWANAKEKPVAMELPVSRRVRIKTKTDAIDRRVVVEVNLRVGGVTQLVEVTLADRGDFDYPVLIGRNFLRDVAVIDVSRAYIHGS